MKPSDKKSAQKELEKIYDTHVKWLKSKNALGQLSESLKRNPKLNLLLKLTVFANIGIWLTFILLLSQNN